MVQPMKEVFEDFIKIARAFGILGIIDAWRKALRGFRLGQ